MNKVAVLVALVAVCAHAAPLYNQEVDLYNDMLMQEEADSLPFDGVTKDQVKVYGEHDKAIDKHGKMELTKRLKPFKVSAARDEAEDKAIKVEDAKIKAAEEANTKAVDETDTGADSAYKASMDTAVKTDEGAMEDVHKILHPHKKAKETAERDFIKSMAKQAEGATAYVNSDTNGNWFRPGSMGDVAPKTTDAGKAAAAEASAAKKKDSSAAVIAKIEGTAKKAEATAKKTEAKAAAAKKSLLPTAAEMELLVPEKTDEEIMLENMRYDEEEMLVQSRAELEEASQQ